MIIAKVTIILILVIAFMLILFREWCKRNPLESAMEMYPFWAYIMAVLIVIDVIGIFASAIWFLFFYL